MLGVALKTSTQAAFSQVNGDLVITSSCGSLLLVGCLAVSWLKLGGRVKKTRLTLFVTWVPQTLHVVCVLLYPSLNVA